MDASEIKSLMAAIAPTIADYCRDVAAPIAAENADLRARLDAFEARVPVIKDYVAAEIAPVTARAEAAEARVMDLETRLALVETRKDFGTVDIAGLMDDAAERAVGSQIGDAARKAMAELPMPKDGVGVAGGMIDRDGNLILTLSNGEAKSLGLVVGQSAELGDVLNAAQPLIGEAVAKAVAAIPPPRDGESIDLDVVRSMIADEVAKLPPAKDGESVDLEEVTKALQPFIVGEIGAEIAKLPVPQDGKSVTVEDVAPLIASEVAKAIEALPPPEPGRDGKDVDMEAVGEIVEIVSEKAVKEYVDRIKERVDKIMAELPVPQDGKDGVGVASAEVWHNILQIKLTDGTVIDAGDVGPRHGKDGTSVTIEDVAPLIASEVEKAVSALPPPEPGKSVTVDDIAPLVASEVEKAVAQLPPPEKGDAGEVDMAEVGHLVDTAVKSAVAALPAPKDGENGIGVANALIDASGALVLTFTDGSVQELGKVKGEDGKPGETFTLDDFGIEQYEDGRTFKFCFTRGDTMHSFEFAFPVPIDRGVHREGQAYERGDVVSFGGSLFIAQRDTSDKPETSDAWRLAVKRGRDGKPGKAEADA